MKPPKKGWIIRRQMPIFPWLWSSPSSCSSCFTPLESSSVSMKPPPFKMFWHALKNDKDSTPFGIFMYRTLFNLFRYIFSAEETALFVTLDCLISLSACQSVCSSVCTLVNKALLVSLSIGLLVWSSASMLFRASE